MAQLQALGPYRERALPNDERYAVAPEVAAYLRMNKSTLYRLMKRDPTFPRAVRLSPNRTAWKVSEVQAWLASRPRVGGDHD